MDKHRDPPARKDDIRTSRQVVAMQPEPDPGTMKSLPNEDFRLGVLATDTAHEAPALRFDIRERSASHLRFLGKGDWSGSA